MTRPKAVAKAKVQRPKAKLVEWLAAIQPNAHGAMMRGVPAIMEMKPKAAARFAGIWLAAIMNRQGQIIERPRPAQAKATILSANEVERPRIVNPAMARTVEVSMTVISP